ncbi:Serine/threonine-protein kinase wnk1, partial [Dionaea muscipula]
MSGDFKFLLCSFGLWFLVLGLSEHGEVQEDAGGTSVPLTLAVVGHDNCGSDLISTELDIELDDLGPLIRELLLDRKINALSYTDGSIYGNDLQSNDDDHHPDASITLKGKRKDDGSIYLRITITDKD